MMSHVLLHVSSLVKDEKRSVHTIADGSTLLTQLISQPKKAMEEKWLERVTSHDCESGLSCPALPEEHVVCPESACGSAKMAEFFSNSQIETSVVRLLES
jgi:hypothetical protein